MAEIQRWNPARVVCLLSSSSVCAIGCRQVEYRSVKLLRNILSIAKASDLKPALYERFGLDQPSTSSVARLSHGNVDVHAVHDVKAV
jgi:hypothetical protein